MFIVILPICLDVVKDWWGNRRIL